MCALHGVGDGIRGPPLSLPCVAIKKSIRLREEAQAKEEEEEGGKAKSSQTSADKLRKILKEEKR